MYKNIRQTIPKVYSVILNYNGWKDAVACIESVLLLNYSNYAIILVDNGSLQDDIVQIKHYLTAKVHLFPKEKEVKKDSETIYSFNLKNRDTDNPDKFNEIEFFIIRMKRNRGFAPGMNVGIKYALSKGDFDYIWLLSNDTIVEADSLSFLVEKAKQYGDKVGIIGPKLLYYDRPELINGVGGMYNKCLGVGRHIGVFERDTGQYDNEKVLDKMDYVIGAAMFVSKKFLLDVGLMCEDYFLYFEEIDWALRGRKLGYKLGYCWKSIVYHKEGGTIGSSSKGKKKSELADYYGLRNRIVFTKKFYPRYLWSVYLGFIIVIWNRLKRRQFRRIGLVIKILLGKDKEKKGLLWN